MLVFSIAIRTYKCATQPSVIVALMPGTKEKLNQQKLAEFYK